MNIKVTESKPGELGITCELSGRPITRSNEFGMFCDSDVCQCEQESMKVASSFRDMIKQITTDLGVEE